MSLVNDMLLMPALRHFQDDWDEADYEALENGHARDTESAWDSDGNTVFQQRGEPRNPGTWNGMGTLVFGMAFSVGSMGSIPQRAGFRDHPIFLVNTAEQPHT